MRIARRGFLGLFGASVATIVIGCDDDGGTTPDGCMIMIADNHAHGPHKLVLPDVDVQAAAAMTYDITGVSTHSHNLTISADQMAMLKTHGTVMVTSTESEDHTHVVTITC